VFAELERFRASLWRQERVNLLKGAMKGKERRERTWAVKEYLF